MRTNNGTVRDSILATPRSSASFKRAIPLAFVLAGNEFGPASAEIASSRKTPPPAIASICASLRSSKASAPVARRMISFNTNKSKDWPSVRVLTRCCSNNARSIPASCFMFRSWWSLAYFRARCPQKTASALSHSETFCPSSFNFVRPSESFSMIRNTSTSKLRLVRYLNASVTGAIMFVYASTCATTVSNAGSGLACAFFASFLPNSRTLSFEIRRITARDPAIAESFAATKEGRRGVTRFAPFSVRF
mmetsp:Transcript_86/g.249  ORF Transcript_86/g.249 Transcript_86/m.249 type:complete len:249 (-) Transcript_86:586-1332(-)